MVIDRIKALTKYKAYIVGGALRNHLLKKAIKDLDIVIESDEKIFFNIIKNLSPKTNLFPLDRERGIYRINISDNLTIDISRTDRIESDIEKRDFTINCLFIELNKVKIKTNKDKFKLEIKNSEIKDITGGLKDLKKQKIRVLTANSIQDDPLRMIRAYRFVADLGFKIDKKTIDIIKNSKDLITNSSPERIRDELIKIFETNDSSQILYQMSQTGLLFSIFPELKLQIKCAEIYYGKGGVLKHTINVIKRLDILYENPQKYLNISSKLLEEAEKEKKLIKMAALLHDIAKPHKAKFIKDRLRFFGHEEYGGIIAERILRNLRYSNNDIRHIKTIISNHLRIGNIAHNNIITRKAILRIFYDLKNYTLGLLILSWADHSSYISEQKLKLSLAKTKEKPFEIKTKLPRTGYKKTIRFLQVVNMICKNYSKYRFVYNLRPFIDGNIIMKTLSIGPSRKVGEIIKKLINLQIEGKIKTKEEALRYIKTLKNI